MLHFFSSLRARLMLLVLLAVIPALVLLIHNAADHRRQEAAYAADNTLKLARLAANDHEELVESGYELLGALGQVPAVRQHDAVACHSVLADFLKRYPLYTDLEAVGAAGEVLCSATVSTPSANRGRAEWFTAIMQGRDRGVAYQTPNDGRNIVVVARGMTDDSGLLQMVLAASLDLSGLARFVADTEASTGAVLTIYDEAGAALAQFPAASQGVREPIAAQPEVAQSTLNRDEGTVEGLGVDGVRRLYAFTRLRTATGSKPLYMRIGIPTAALYAQADHEMMLNLGTLMAVGLLALAAAWFASDLFVLRQVRLVLSATQQLRSGDLSARTGAAYGRGELGAVARAFDNMAVALEQRDAERRAAEAETRRLNDVLEQRVAERTAQLAATNQELTLEIAERAEAQLALRESEQRYHTLAEVAPIGIFKTNAQGAVLYGNEHWSQITGLSATDVRTDDWLQMIHPADREQIITAWHESVAAGASYQVEYRLCRPGAEETWVSVQAVAERDVAGQVVGYVGAIADITESKRAARALQRYAEEQAVLYAVSAAAASSLDATRLLPTLLDLILPAFSADAGWVLLRPADDESAYRIGAARGVPEPFLLAEAAVPRQLCLICGPLLAGLNVPDQPHLLADCGCLPRAALDAAELHSHIGIPLYAADRLLGVLNIGWRLPRPYLPADQALLTTIGRQLGIVLENARLYEAATARARQLAILNQIGQAITSTLDLDLVLRILLDRAREVTGAQSAAVALLDAATGDLAFRQVVGVAAEPLLEARLKSGAGIAGWVVSHQQSAIVRDVTADPRLNTEDWMARAFAEMEDMVCVPLIARGVVLGVVEVFNRCAGAFCDDDARLLESVAAQAAVAIENARLYQAEREQRELAETQREIAAALVATLDVDVVLDRLLAEIGRVVPHDAANVMLIEGDSARIVRWRGDQPGGASNIVGFQHAIIYTPVGRRLLQGGEPLVIPDTAADADWPRTPAMSWLRSWVSAPIKVRGTVIGLLNVISATPGFFQPGHGEQLRVFADQAGIALENARLYQDEREQFRRLQESQAQLVQAEKTVALGRLAAALAHEINNPLQAIRSHLELVMDFPLPADERAEYLRVARQEIERLSEIARRVLNFSRPAQAARAPVAVADLIGRTLALANKQLQHAQIQVRVDPTPAVTVYVSPDQLIQVFLNLVINAVEAGPGTSQLIITTGIEGDEVFVSFADDGPAIPAEHLVHVFEPFFTTKPDGTGLGLSVSHNLIEQHGGVLEAANQTPTRGVIFTVRLPRYELDQPPDIKESV
jgi:PAS domain S-box-containing protein